MPHSTAQSCNDNWASDDQRRPPRTSSPPRTSPLDDPETARTQFSQADIEAINAAAAAGAQRRAARATLARSTSTAVPGSVVGQMAHLLPC